MQREIKFRGKPVPGELWNINSPPEWIYGFPYSEDGINITHLVTHMPNWELVSGAPDNHNWWVKVLPESVGQYTGLKDIMTTNGFEHDVIERDASDGKGKVRGVIYFEEGQFRVKWLDKNKGWNNSLYLHLQDSKIIGSTIDNPELIKP